ncbi:unnamed protein product [Cylicocyclus nassatus]|uniref:Uncharacterized protein n=1 Tax=Cylicocyclus nassatus TaxID=53992 RepID=A0AA36GHU4_CYLNA|nr:unnamed protein product [Cylicocyclus nassatus]
MDRLLEDLSTDILRYPTSKGNPFSWPAPAGISGGILAIRARITFDFRRIFMADGRKTLCENNSKKRNRYKDNLFIRNSIKDAYARENKKCIDITSKKSLIKIGNNEPVKPAVASVLLNLDLSSWTGLPIKELLSKQEKTKIRVQSSSHLKKRPIHVIEEEPPKKKALA